MTIANAADNAECEPEDDLGFAIIPIWLLRDDRLEWATKLLYVVLTSYQTGARTPYTKALEDQAMALTKTYGLAYDETVRVLEGLGLLRIFDEGEQTVYSISFYEGGLL